MHTNLTKVLGISLLAIVGILAVNASAAHATWQLLKNGANAANNLLNLKATLLEGELLIPNLLTIKCTGGSATLHLEGGTILKGKAHVALTGCTVLSFSQCEVRSSTTAVGSKSLLLSGSG